jgi:hypothetical protein
LSITGISSLISQYLMMKVLRAKNTLFYFRLSLGLYVLVFYMFPLTNLLVSGPQWAVWSFLILAMSLRQLLSTFAFTCTNILV